MNFGAIKNTNFCLGGTLKSLLDGDVTVPHRYQAIKTKYPLKRKRDGENNKKAYH